jgi:ABC-type multidrug transport system ATPase subunit
MAEPMLVVDRVTKIVGRRTLVREASFVAHPGEVLALVGPNGAGKSTLIRMIVGAMPPTRGMVTVDGFGWERHRKEFARRVGYMPDDYRFGGRLSARETLMFWANLRGVQRERVDEALEETGLADVGRKPAATFSKGMRQRLLFAQAMLARPPLLVLDEPTSGLDPLWQVEFVRLVRKLSEAGHTVVFSTHQPEVAEALADRVVLVDRGEVLEEGSAAEALRAFFRPLAEGLKPLE